MSLLTEYDIYDGFAIGLGCPLLCGKMMLLTQGNINFFEAGTELMAAIFFTWPVIRADIGRFYFLP
ncbi:hypothetical protein D3C73_1191020 [compost metagenome]